MSIESVYFGEKDAWGNQRSSKELSKRTWKQKRAQVSFPFDLPKTKY